MSDKVSHDTAPVVGEPVPSPAVGNPEPASGTEPEQPAPSTETNLPLPMRTMTHLSYNKKTKIHRYRDDVDGSIWKTTSQKTLYGELIPVDRRHYTQPLQLRPPIDRNNKTGVRTWTNLYLVHPNEEMYIPNGNTGNSGPDLGVILKRNPKKKNRWEHLDHWPVHLVRKAQGEPVMDKGRLGLRRIRRKLKGAKVKLGLRS